jgi:glycosyltransferase involved in cell wall biosynthesis
MHVLILNQTFHPDVAATAQHMWDLARHLDAAGHHVTAITSQSVYGSSERFSRTCERIRNITIHRVPQTAFGKVHTAGRMADFLSFYLSAFWRMNTLRAPDVILALTSPPMISVLGHVQKQFRTRDGRRIALVNHVMDLYPDAAIAMGVLGRGGPITRLMSGLTRRTLTACDALIALGTDMRDLLVRQYLPPSRANRVHVVQPWADKSEITPTPRDTNPLRAQLGLKDDFVLLYSGNFGQAHDVDTIVNAIRATGGRTHLKWCFTGGGRGMKILQDLANKETWDHVKFLPYQPREALNDLLNLADVHLISQAPAFTGIVVPSKLFGILAAGQPSIMVGPSDAEASRILAACDAGVVVRPGDVDGMLAAIDRLQNDPETRRAMGERARNALCDVYDSRLSCAKIERILLQAVEDANADPR